MIKQTKHTKTKQTLCIILISSHKRKQDKIKKQKRKTKWSKSSYIQIIKLDVNHQTEHITHSQKQDKTRQDKIKKQTKK